MSLLSPLLFRSVAISQLSPSLLTVAFSISQAQEMNTIQRTLVEAWGWIRETFIDPIFNHQDSGGDSSSMVLYSDNQTETQDSSMTLVYDKFCKNFLSLFAQMPTKEFYSQFFKEATQSLLVISKPKVPIALVLCLRL